MLKTTLHLAALIFILPLVLCGWPGQLMAADPVAAKDSAAELVPKAVPDTNREYRTNPLDILTISVFMEDDLQKEYRVAQNGCISYPFINQVKVVGLTVSEVEQKLTSLLKPDYFVDPEITVFVKEYNWRRIYVLGEVNNPGSLKIPPEKDLSLVEAISLSGGFSKIAAVSKIRIIRIENGKEKTIEVDVKSIIKQGDKSNDIKLKPNDIVIVPERFF